MLLTIVCNSLVTCLLCWCQLLGNRFKFELHQKSSAQYTTARKSSVVSQTLQISLSQLTSSCCLWRPVLFVCDCKATNFSPASCRPFFKHQVATIGDKMFEWHPVVQIEGLACLPSAAYWPRVAWVAFECLQPFLASDDNVTGSNASPFLYNCGTLKSLSRCLFVIQKGTEKKIHVRDSAILFCRPHWLKPICIFLLDGH